MLTIDVEPDNYLNENKKLKLLADRINSKKRTQESKECKYNANKGEILGRGQFGKVYEFVDNKRLKKDSIYENTNENKYVIKDSNTYAKVNKIRIQEEIVEEQMRLLDYHDDEITNTKNYSSLGTEQYPRNFIKYVDSDVGSPISANRTESLDSCDEDFLVNQIILERVFGEMLCMYEGCNDMEDMELIFFQVVFIVLSMNLLGGFHNDIKATNIIIEKSKVLELELNFPQKVSELLNINFNITLKSDKEYFPLVKFVDYSFSYVNYDNNLLFKFINDNKLKNIKEIKKTFYFFPIEIYHVIRMFENTEYKETENFKELKSFCEKLLSDKYLFYDLPRVTKKNIHKYQEISYHGRDLNQETETSLSVIKSYLNKIRKVQKVQKVQE